MIHLFGWLWWWVFPIRKTLAIENFKSAFPDAPLSNLRRSIGEIVWGYFELFMGRRAIVHGAELVQAGGVCLAGHFGAWDLALISAGEKVPATIFVRTPQNPLAAWWITRQRERAGLELLPPTGSALSAYRSLRAGRLVVFVQDQRHNQGVPVPFFGRPAWTSRGFSVLGVHSQAPLFGAWQWRDSSGQHHIQIERLHVDLPDDPEEATKVLTLASQQYYEQKIRERPHSWLWLHDRWRSLEQ